MRRNREVRLAERSQRHTRRMLQALFIAGFIGLPALIYVGIVVARTLHR